MAETATSLARRESWTKGGPVVSHLEGSEITALKGRAVATIADPSPLGLWVHFGATPRWC